VYFEDAVAERWRISFHKTTSCTGQSDNSDSVLVFVQLRSVLSVAQRYRAAFTEAQKLVTMASEVSMKKFCTRLSVLQNLVYLYMGART